MTSKKSERAADTAAIPLVEERVTIDKRAIEGRTVTVTTRPVNESRTIREPVMRETVTVERVPVGEVIDAVPEIREEGELTIVPVVEERITVVKELVLTEEIHLRRGREETIAESTVELRRTEVEVSGAS